MMARLQHVDTLHVVGGGLAGVISMWRPDAFFWAVVALACSSALDWIFGRHAAQKRGDFSRTIAREGVSSKAAQMCTLLLLRTLEALVPLLAGIPGSNGAVASAVAVLLLIEDIESIERHGIELGGKPIPGLSPFLRRVRTLTGSEPRRGASSEPLAAED